MRRARRPQVVVVSMLALLSVAGVLAAGSPPEYREVWISRGQPPQEVARFTVEIADEPAEWRQGLMARPTLGPDRGMLFLFPDMAPRSFWMMNTLIALDMLFIDADGRILNIASNVPPCQPPRRCPSYRSAGPAQYVLEIAGGRAQALDIRAGDRVHF